MVKKASGVKRKVPDEDVSGEGNVAEKAEDAALDEEEEQRQEGAYDEVPGDEEDEVREEYADGMQMHHPSTWVKFKKGWTPVYRTKDGVELYRKVGACPCTCPECSRRDVPLDSWAPGPAKISDQATPSYWGSRL